MDKEKEFNIKNSYITKDELISIIENINFEFVQRCSMELITGFLIDKDNIKPLTKDIEIN